MNNQSLIVATAIGLVLQLTMVVVGHFVPAFREKGFAIGGMTFSLLAGAIYVYLARGAWPDSLIGGAIAGGACALLGIAVSAALKDVPVTLLALGTISSIVTGLIGAALSKLIFK